MLSVYPSSPLSFIGKPTAGEGNCQGECAAIAQFQSLVSGTLKYAGGGVECKSEACRFCAQEP